jgi:Flp pilus assembly protein TadG
MIRGRWHDDRGMTTSQVAILFPVVLMWLMLIVQYGLWWHAKQVANAAAAEAVTAAHVPHGTATVGEDAAKGFLDQSGNLTDVAIVVTRTPELVTVEVTGNAPVLVPGFDWGVTSRAQAPTERFIPEPQR